MLDLTSPCIEHTGKRDYMRDHRYGYKHRRAYIEAKGEIPEGLEIDHVCKNKRCINPLHLEAVTHRENVLRGEVTRKPKFCKRGHEFTPENTIKHARGRKCRICHNEASLRSYHKRVDKLIRG